MIIAVVAALSHINLHVRMHRVTVYSVYIYIYLYTCIKLTRQPSLIGPPPKTSR